MPRCNAWLRRYVPAMATFEIILVIFLTVINGLLAMSELAIASSRMPKLRAMAEQRVHGARRALALASDPGRFLSTVQIGITLIGILAGAVSGATLGERASAQLLTWGVPESVAEPLGFGAVIALITYLSLIIGELVPKQIALTNPERIACLAAPAMTILARVSAPIVWLLDRSGKLVLTLLGQNRMRDETVTDAEIHSIIAEAEAAGVIEPEERDMISGVMRLGDRPVKSVMIPRADVVMADITTPPADIGKLIAQSGHSRLVVYHGNPDNILGVVQTKDIAAQAMRGRTLNLRRLVKAAPVIPEGMDALDVVSLLKSSDVHFGLVHDEYGSFEGIVTAADILETIVGAFREEKRVAEPELVEREDGSLITSGWAPIETLADRLKLRLPAQRSYQTIAGFVLELFGRLPQVGETVAREGFIFEILDLDGRRIDKVLIRKQPPAMRRAGR
jgi:putative hemolysin